MKTQSIQKLGIAAAYSLMALLFLIVPLAQVRAQTGECPDGSAPPCSTNGTSLAPGYATPTNPQYTSSSGGSSLSQVSDFNGLAKRISSIGTVAVYLLTGLAMVYIVWNIVQYFINGSEAENRKAAGMNILWGIVGLAIILSLWGLVNVLLKTFGTTSTNAPTGSLPQANFISNGSSNGAGTQY